MHTFFSNDLI